MNRERDEIREKEKEYNPLENDFGIHKIENYQSIFLIIRSCFYHLVITIIFKCIIVTNKRNKKLLQLKYFMRNILTNFIKLSNGSLLFHFMNI